MSIKRKIYIGIASAAIMCASLVITASAISTLPGSCGNTTNCIGDLYRSSSGAVATLTTAGNTPDSVSVYVSYTYRIPNGGPQVTTSDSGASRAEVSINYAHYPVSASASYTVKSGTATWSDSLSLTF